MSFFVFCISSSEYVPKEKVEHLLTFESSDKRKYRKRKQSAEIAAKVTSERGTKLPYVKDPHHKKGVSDIMPWMTMTGEMSIVNTNAKMHLVNL